MFPLRSQKWTIQVTLVLPSPRRVCNLGRSYPNLSFLYFEIHITRWKGGGWGVESLSRVNFYGGKIVPNTLDEINVVSPLLIRTTFLALVSFFVV